MFKVSYSKELKTINIKYLRSLSSLHQPSARVTHCLICARECRFSGQGIFTTETKIALDKLG